jgi:hypothetical protein
VARRLQRHAEPTGAAEVSAEAAAQGRSGRPRRVFDDDEVARILALYRSGMSMADIAAALAKPQHAQALVHHRSRKVLVSLAVRSDGLAMGEAKDGGNVGGVEQIVDVDLHDLSRPGIGDCSVLRVGRHRA